MANFDLDQFVLQLREAAVQPDAQNRLRELMNNAFKNPESIRDAMPAFDNNDEILFEDDSVSIWYCKFLPNLHVPPHDHQTTATIGVYEGAEDNHFYLRENGKLVHKTSKRIGPGQVISIKPEGIHSVEAAEGAPSCAIHVYQAALTTIERSLFDWKSGESRPFTDENYEAMKQITG